MGCAFFDEIDYLLAEGQAINLFLVLEKSKKINIKITIRVRQVQISNSLEHELAIA